MSYERVIRSAKTSDLTIPIGGGIVTASLSLADFGLSRFEVILNVRAIRKEPVVGDVYEPSVGFNATGDAIGLTLAAGTGTTLAAEVDVLGNP
ncbi:MAG: hypothetical protein ACXQTL_05760 [Methanosarcinales archaeon]